MRFKTMVYFTVAFLLIMLQAASAFSDEMPMGDTGIPDDYNDTMKDFSQALPNYDGFVDQLPAAYDWRDKGMVTPAKDQGNCSSCWAFTSVGAFESKILMMDGKKYDLSEQQQVSCDSSKDGCRGGNMSALKYWYNVKPMTEACTGYCAYEASCANYAQCNPLDYNTTGYYTVDTSSVDEIKTSLYNDGPAYFRFNVYSDFSDFWNTSEVGVVYTQSSGTLQGGHAVLMIGWDDERGAWLCKNSWGGATSGPNGDGTFWIAYTGHDSDLGFGMANVKIKKTPMQSSNQVLLFDFGSSRTPTDNDSENVWNNISEKVGCSNSGKLTDLVTVDGQTTSIDLVMRNRFNRVNQNGSLNFADFPAKATGDSLFGNTKAFLKLANIFPKFKLTALDPQRTYDFAFYASQRNAKDNRETGYSIVGANSGFTKLNPSGNIATVATVTGIKPNAAGEITIRIAPTKQNNSTYHFTYLGVMKLESTVE